MVDNVDGDSVHLHKLLGELQFHFSLNISSQLQNERVVADLLEFAAPEIGEVISGRKSFKSAAKSVGKQTLKKQLGGGSRRGGSKQKRIIPTKSTKQSSRSRRDFLQTFLVEHAKQQFSVPTFCGSVWKSWRESPNC